MLDLRAISRDPEPTRAMVQPQPIRRCQFRSNHGTIKPEGQTLRRGLVLRWDGLSTGSPAATNASTVPLKYLVFTS